MRIWKVIITQNGSGGLIGTPKFLASLCGHADGVMDVKISKVFIIIIFVFFCFLLFSFVFFCFLLFSFVFFCFLLFFVFCFLFFVFCFLFFCFFVFFCFYFLTKIFFSFITHPFPSPPQVQYIVSASRDESIVVWSLETGKVVARFRGHVGPVNSIFVMPSGLVISGSSDKSMRVWKYTPPAPKN